MSVSTESRWPGLASSASAGIIVAGAILAAAGASADVIKREDMLDGITTTRPQCDATPQTVWVNVFDQGFCIRYYLSTAGGEDSRPIVFLAGDRFWPVNTKTWQWAPSTEKRFRDGFDDTARDVDTDDLMNIADAFSKMAKTTAIYLARIGIDGTSGYHVFRRTLIELHMMNAALDALKQRRGFEGFHLAGQSGGSSLVAGLAEMRGDIGCAIAGSGRFTPQDSSKHDGGRTHFDPVRSIPLMARNRSLRFIMVTDRADQFVPLNHQTGFAKKMRETGIHIPQYFVEATDDHHHDVISYTRLVAAGCVLGRSDADIATAVGTMNKGNAEFNEQRRKETAALAKNGITSLPGSDHFAPGRHARTSGKSS